MHHTSKRIAMIAAAAISSGAVMLGMAAEAQAQARLAMGGTHGQSAFYSYQVAVMSDWNQAIDGMDMTIQELGGASASTQALLRGEVDVGISVTSSDFAALEEGHDTLRTLYFFAPLPLNWVVAADSGIDSIAAIAGSDFNPGSRGSATERQVDAVIDILGLGVEPYRADGSDALDAYQNRRIDGFVKAGLHPDGYIQQAHSARPVMLLGMTREDAERVAGELGFFSVAEVNPEDNYGEQDSALVTLQTAIGINTTSDLPEEVAYAIASRVFSPEGLAAAVSGYPPADRANALQLTLDAAVAPLHAGVVRYYVEQGIEVPERLIPDEYEG
jgi:TRAP transporter TAXI family solute receptor